MDKLSQLWRRWRKGSATLGPLGGPEGGTGKLLNGYHYTTDQNWKKIKKEGFCPGELDTREFGKTQGTWVWSNRIKSQSKFGTIMRQMALKGENKIVELKVSFPQSDICSVNGEMLILKHLGSIGNWVYHQSEPALIVTRPIPPERIKLCAKYKLTIQKIK